MLIVACIFGFVSLVQFWWILQLTSEIDAIKQENHDLDQECLQRTRRIMELERVTPRWQQWN